MEYMIPPGEAKGIINFYRKALNAPARVRIFKGEIVEEVGVYLEKTWAIFRRDVCPATSCISKR